MKHLRTVSRAMPAKAITGDHPGIVDSINGLLADPITILAFHIRVLLNKPTTRNQF